MPENATCFDLTPLSWQRRGSRNDQAPHQFHHGFRCCVKPGSWYFTASTEKTSCADRLGIGLVVSIRIIPRYPKGWGFTISLISWNDSANRIRCIIGLFLRVFSMVFLMKVVWGSSSTPHDDLQDVLQEMTYFWCGDSHNLHRMMATQMENQTLKQTYFGILRQFPVCKRESFLLRKLSTNEGLIVLRNYSSGISTPPSFAFRMI